MLSVAVCSGERGEAQEDRKVRHRGQPRPAKWGRSNTNSVLISRLPTTCTPTTFTRDNVASRIQSDCSRKGMERFSPALLTNRRLCAMSKSARLRLGTPLLRAVPAHLPGYSAAVHRCSRHNIGGLRVPGAQAARQEMHILWRSRPPHGRLEGVSPGCESLALGLRSEASRLRRFLLLLWLTLGIVRPRAREQSPGKFRVRPSQFARLKLRASRRSPD